jgi:hypothetical protein
MSKCGELSHGQGSQLLNKLEDVGLDSIIAQWIIENLKLAEEMMMVAKRYRFHPKQQQWASKIMGDNFISVETVAGYLGFPVGHQHISDLSQIPFSKKTLEMYKNTHFLVPNFGLSIKTLCEVLIQRKDAIQIRCFFESSLKEREDFRDYGKKPRWQLISKTIEDRDCSNIYRQNLHMFILPEDDRPNMRILDSQSLIFFLLIIMMSKKELSHNNLPENIYGILASDEYNSHARHERCYHRPIILTYQHPFRDGIVMDDYKSSQNLKTISEIVEK